MRFRCPTCGSDRGTMFLGHYGAGAADCHQCRDCHVILRGDQVEVPA